MTRSWPTGLHQDYRDLLAEWLRGWDAAWMLEEIRVELSGRMTSSLGRAYFQERLIRLNARLLEAGSEPLLREVLCHEAAHLVAHERHGRAARPHGREWRSLVAAAGVRPRATVPREECSFALPARRRRRRRRRSSLRRILLSVFRLG